MKTLNAQSQIIQKSNSLSFIDKIILYKQFDGIITEIITQYSVKISGNAVSFFTLGNYVLCPLKTFESEYIVSATPTHSAGYTTLTFSNSNFTSDDIGKTLAVKIDITDKLLKDGIGKIQFGVEGNELTEFDSGYIDVTVDNSNKYFLNDSDGNGLFNDNLVFWLKYTTRFRNSGDTDLIYFGGIVDLTDFSPDFFNKTITIRAYGHSYELSRYPAYNIIKENSSELNRIGGINIINFTPSDYSEPGIKKIYYKPFNTSKMQGVEVKRVSSDTTAGIKVLEFRFPYYFKWNNGNWYKVGSLSDTTSSSGELKMYQNGGSGDSGYAIVKFGDTNGLNEFPDIDTQLWVNVKDEITEGGTRDITDQGSPTLKFDNGVEQDIVLHIQRVLKYDSSVNLYTDITSYTNSPETNFVDVEILESNNDELIFISPERFWGIEAILSDFFTASSVSYYYSIGGSTWSVSPIDSITNGFIDGTNGFRNNGKILWNELPGWAVNDIVVGTTINYKGYMVKCVRNTASSNAYLSEAKKVIRLNGQNNDFLEVSFNQSLLVPKDIQDDIIIKYDANNWTFGTWYDNLTLQYLLETSLDKSHYGSGKRLLGDMKVTKDNYTLNIWGKPPKYNYTSEPTAFDVDWANETVYVAVGLEIWRCTFQGLWEKLGNIELWASGSLASQYQVRKIWVDSLNVYIYTTREINSIHHIAYFTRINKTTGLHAVLNSFTSAYSCRVCQRNGTGYFQTSNYYRQIGQFGSVNGGDLGENICIPFRQNIWVFDNPSAYALYPSPNLYNTTSGFPEWYFDNAFGGGIADNSGPIYHSQMGFFGLHTNSGSVTPKPKAGFNWTMGQQGCEIYDKTNNNIYLFKYEVDGVSAGRARMRDIVNNWLERPIYYNEPDLPICHCWDETNDIMYFGWTIWYDNRDNFPSYSYISRYAKTGSRVTPVDKLVYYNADDLSLTDIESIANVDGDLSTYEVKGTGFMFYIGHNKKFRNIGVDFYNASNDYVFEYWNGTAWTALEHTNEPDIPDRILTFHMPYTWAKTSVNSSENLWYIRIRCIGYNSTDYLGGLGLYEEVIWDSQYYGGYTEGSESVFEKYMPTWMCYQPTAQAIHGVAFNRDPLGTNNPFQWVYFVFNIAESSFNIANIGVNYTFDGTYLMKDLVYDSYNDCVHFIAENIRYKDKPSYMVKAWYDWEDTQSIDLTQEIIPRETEWGSMDTLVCNPSNGNIFGLTKGKDKILWEYSRSFYPRIELAQFTETESILDVLKYITQIMNCYYTINSNRKIIFFQREMYNGEINLIWNENLTNKKPKITYWKNKYDAVMVQFQNPFDEEYQGVKKKGFVSWNKVVLSINNPLIQNGHIAQFIADESFDFFNKLRMEFSNFGTIPLIQLELLDKANILIPNKILDIDSGKSFIITNIIFDSDKNMNIKLLEIKGN